MVNEKSTPFSDTIFALSSGSPPSGVAVIRVSGRHVRAALNRIAGGILAPRRAELRELSAGNDPLDRAVVLFFPAPGSFTGEDVAELHLHGGRAVVQGVLDALGRIDGCRFAEAGEFTRRAFLNGKVDLTEAEALADLVTAETEAQRRFALTGAAGAHRKLYSRWQARITRARALIEADLDFSDEEDVPGSVAEASWRDIGALVAEISTHLSDAHAGEILREGFNVVLLGAPNSGKSSLLNCLAQRDVAIVTEEAGTTRDLIDVALDIGGYKIIVTDTAGVREGESKAEALGVKKALERGGAADLVLVLTDLSLPVDVGEIAGARDIVRIGTKCDLVSSIGKVPECDLVLSAKTGKGVGELVRLIGERAGKAVPKGSLVPVRARHTELLRRCLRNLERAFEEEIIGVELRAEMLRAAAHSLGRITGEVGVEDLLDVIFSEFCIGK